MRPLLVSFEITTGAFLLGCAALGGLLFVHRPQENRLDAKGFAFLPAAPTDHSYLFLASFGSLRVLIVVAGLCTLISFFRDRARALSCALGPVVAVLVTERIGKPLVGRHLFAYGAYSYPSGTVTAVAALATIVYLISPKVMKPAVFLAGLVVIGAVSAAVVALRWHFPTDALGGALIGSGAALFIDGLFHLPGTLLSEMRRPAPPPLPAERDRVLQSQ